MDKRFLMRVLGALVLPALVFTSCSDNDEPGNKGNDDDNTPENTEGRFVIAATTTASAGSVPVIVTAESIDGGSVTLERNGLTNDGATQWVFHGTEYLYGLTYNQGNAGTTRSYVLGEDGQVRARDLEYKVSRFSSYGAYDDNILSMSSGNGPIKFADANGNLPQTLLFTKINVKEETSTANDTESGKYSVENYLGNGEYVTLSGAEQSGRHLYSGVIPMGLSAYGTNVDNGKYILPGNEDLVATADGGSGGSSYSMGSLSGTQYPNSCWVAIYDNGDFLNPVIAKTDKISYAAGRFRSQYYQTIWAAENGDIYVFSPSFAKTQTDKRQKTTLPAGVARIPAGKTEFDDYYCNIEALSGGRSFMRCWSAGGNYFILVMYDTAEFKATTSATSLAIFDADAKTLKYVTGGPTDVTSIGKTVYVHNGSVYIAINSASSSPAIYRIDPATAKAEKGITVTSAAEINGFGFMTVAK